LTPIKRWDETSKLWQFYLHAGGTLDPEPDPQSPFDPFLPRPQAPAYGGQACVFYGAAEFSQKGVIVLHADAANFQRLTNALEVIQANCI